MKRPVKTYLLILLFPLTIYFFIATFLLFLISLLEKLNDTLLGYSEAPGWTEYETHEWHHESIWFAIFFPIFVFLLGAWGVIVLFYATITAFFRCVYEILKFLWEKIVEIWEEIVTIFKAIWEWTVEAIERMLEFIGEKIVEIWEEIVTIIKAIWEWTVETIDHIWSTIKNIF